MHFTGPGKKGKVSIILRIISDSQRKGACPQMGMQAPYLNYLIVVDFTFDIAGMQ